MKNFVQSGNPLELVAPYDVASGAGFLVGAIFAVAADTALSGAAVIGHTEGVFTLAKIGSQAWAVGDVIYWDNGNKRCTKVGTGNTRIGVAQAVAGSGAGVVTGNVLLMPAAGAALRVVAGEAALDGANPTPITTGLTLVIAFVATLKGTAAPGDNTSVLTADIAAGDVNVYEWKNTGGTDPTLVASTGTESFYWVAVGY